MNTFSLEQKRLLLLLSWMQPICTRKTVLEITHYICLSVSQKEIIIKSTDLELSLQANCPLLENDCTEHLQFLVHGKRLYDMIKELEGTITLSYENNQLFIHAVNSDFSLNTKSSDTFPSFPERIENIMHINADIFEKIIDKVAFLIPQNNANLALNGLLMEIGTTGLRFTATDGHSLAQLRSNQYTHHQDQSWLMPRRAVLELKKLIESSAGEPIFIGLCNNQLVFSAHQFNFFSKLLHNQFPAYESILDSSGFIESKVDRASFVKTLRRASCLLSGTFIATDFLFNETTMHVKITNKEVGNFQETLLIETSLKLPLDIRFYTPYLLAGLQAFQDTSLTFLVKNAQRPIMFCSSLQDWKMNYLVMPVCSNAV